MDGIESAIRNALSRGDARDRSFRERVYRSVFAALEKKLGETQGLSDADAQARREGLKQRIIVIEREFAVPARAPAVDRETPDPQDDEGDFAPRVSAVDAPGGYGEVPAVETRSNRVANPDQSESLAVRPRREVAAGEMVLPGVAGDMSANTFDEADAERRRPWGIILIIAVVLAIAAIGGWWAMETGLFGRDDGSVPNPPVTLEEEEFTPEAPPPLSQDGGTELEWVTVFSAAEPDAAVAASGASIEPLEDEGRPFLRLRSRSAAAPVNVRVDGSALAAVAGGPVVFNVIARAQEGQETQISVSCDFGAMGDCGRRRYVVGLHIADFLFDFELGASGAAADGIVSIVTDVEGTGKAIDLFEIRLARAE